MSSQQLDQCETLLEFIRDSSQELKWLNEKEDEELTRNWNATTMSVDIMREHFQVRQLLNPYTGHAVWLSLIYSSC